MFDLFYWQAKQEVLYRNSSETKQALKAALEELQHIGLKLVNGGKYARALAMVRDMTYTLMRFYSRDARYFCFTEWDDKGSPYLKAVEKNYRFRLNRMLWNRPMGIVLTSGTLAAGRDMEFFKDRMGLTNSERLTESYTPSPFDYRSNCLLYLPGDLPSCKSNYEFRVAAAERIAELITATAGHALVLCTSYREMNELFQKIHAMHLQYPLFAMPRRGDKYLQAFRASGNGVLFAAGSCWEGMDFPGDIVSSLIIVRLPFPRRDALHDGERQRYMDVRQFIKEVAVPEMQVKLRQGYVAGASFQSLAVEMQENGVRYHEDNPAWNKHMIKRILENERYTGTADFPAIFSQELFDRVKRLRESKRIESKKPRKKKESSSPILLPPDQAKPILDIKIVKLENQISQELTRPVMEPERLRDMICKLATMKYEAHFHAQEIITEKAGAASVHFYITD
ncbi:recombinase family protein [Christensenellaceae bacterium OttesenSCG-928-M15]|nr:recombinase family protein [Christensenellaceae bacterium OttesenSCG-928-M15]